MQSPIDLYGMTIVGMQWIIHLADFAFRSSLILALAWFITFLLRRTSASTRHLVWSITFTLVLLVPLSMLMIPQIPVPFIPSVQYSFPSLAFDGTGLLNVANGGGSWFDELATAGIVVWPGVVFLIWSGGALLMFLRLALGFGIVHQLSLGDSTLRFSHRKLDLFAEICAQLGLKRPVQLLRREKVRMPMTSGALRPVIILPAEAEEWADARFRSVLLHELAHVKRLDFLTKQIAAFAKILCWFNPLVWLAERRMHEEMETACDDLVLRYGVKASDYALDLADIVRRFGVTSGVLANGGIAMACRRNSLPGRLRRILNPDIDRNNLQAKSVAFLSSMLILFTLPAFVIQPFFKPKPCSNYRNHRERSAVIILRNMKQLIEVSANKPVQPEQSTSDDHAVG